MRAYLLGSAPTAAAFLASSVCEANHEGVGIIDSSKPLSIGAPLHPVDRTDFYSGVGLRILPSAPPDLRFTTGNAAWLGMPVSIVDTAMEQSAFTLDPNTALGLQRIPPPPGPFLCCPPGGLLIGDILPDHYYGNATLLNQFIAVAYRRTGSTAIEAGEFFFPIVPEPSTFLVSTLAFVGLLASRPSRRS